MGVRDWGLGAVVGLGAAAFAAQAGACSFAGDFNRYEERQLGAAAAYAAAVSVDWVRIEQPGVPACPRLPSPGLAADEAADDRAWAAYPERCQTPDAWTVPFVAMVSERLKGASPDRFTLVHRWSGGEGWDHFSDLRVLPAEFHAHVAVREKAAADRRHRSDAFWLNGRLGPDFDLSSSCGGRPTLDPRMSYVVFRDAQGGVIALEPVRHEDDELLARLRRATVEAGAFGRRLEPAAFFRSADRMVLVRVNRCRKREERVDAVLLRGQAADFPREPGDDAAPSPASTPGLDVDFVGDWFEWVGERCGGQTLLIVDHPGERVEPADLDWTYALALAPGAYDGVLARDDRRYGVHLRRRPVPRVVTVWGGEVRLADLRPAVLLTAPSTITVEQAFAWFAEGRSGGGK